MVEGSSARALGSACAALALLAAPTGAAHANVFAADGADPRRFADTAGPDAAYAPIGRTTTERPVRIFTGDDDASVAREDLIGTGFMIGPCLMATNFHTVFGDVDTSPDPRRAHYVTFEIGAGADRHFRYKARARVLAWGDLAAGEDGDWALATVDGCPGKDTSVGWFRAAAVGLTPPEGLEVSMAGFAADRARDRLSVQGACRIHEVQSAELIHDCASTGGDSGAPLLVRRAGGWAVVGLTSGADEDEKGVLRHFDRSHGNWAVRIDTILANANARALVQEEDGAESSSVSGAGD